MLILNISSYYTVYIIAVMLTKIWDYVLNKFWTCRPQLLNILISHKEFHDIQFPELFNLANGNFKSLREFLATAIIIYPRINYTEISYVNRLLFNGKAIGANKIIINNNGCSVESLSFSTLVEKKRSSDYEYTQILIYADDWQGTFAEYDIVSQYWPIIPKRLYDCIRNNNQSGAEVINGRSIEVHKYGNGITAIAEQLPELVHPALGLYHEENTFSRQGQNVLHVGKFDKAVQGFWLNELNGCNKAPHYVLFAFINPKTLSSDDEKELSKFKNIPGYEKGLKEGWSLLFLGGHDGKPVIQPGLSTRKEMVNMIDPIIWDKIKDKDYRYLSDSSLKEHRS